ncbi:hypothetical protein B2G69_08220 [Methylorubrum zatmanii]|nr:hypothetical protein [Methylorubrum zatmanii]ARO54134.1 hypothetical protein B2G69_08220 [Methylorubrum zatmanii]
MARHDEEGYDASEIPELALLSVTAWAAQVTSGDPEEARYAQIYGIDEDDLAHPAWVIHRLFSARLNSEGKEHIYEGTTMLAHLLCRHAFPHVEDLYWAYEADAGDSPTTRAERREARIKTGCHSKADLAWLQQQAPAD